MKIVCADNFDRENVDDELICENINEYYGEEITKFLNKKFSGNTASKYYRLAPDNYKLFVFRP